LLQKIDQLNLQEAAKAINVSTIEIFVCFCRCWQVKKVNVKEGQTVNADDVLVELE